MNTKCRRCAGSMYWNQLDNEAQCLQCGRTEYGADFVPLDVPRKQMSANGRRAMQTRERVVAAKQSAHARARVRYYAETA